MHNTRMLTFKPLGNDSSTIFARRLLVSHLFDWYCLTQSLISIWGAFTLICSTLAKFVSMVYKTSAFSRMAVASIMESASASHFPSGIWMVERHSAAFSAISLSTLRIFGSSLVISCFIFCSPVESLALRKGV